MYQIDWLVPPRHGTAGLTFQHTEASREQNIGPPHRGRHYGLLLPKDSEKESGWFPLLDSNEDLQVQSLTTLPLV